MVLWKYKRVLVLCVESYAIQLTMCVWYEGLCTAVDCWLTQIENGTLQWHMHNWTLNRVERFETQTEIKININKTEREILNEWTVFIVSSDRQMANFQKIQTIRLSQPHQGVVCISTHLFLSRGNKTLFFRFFFHFSFSFTRFHYKIRASGTKKIQVPTNYIVIIVITHTQWHVSVDND